MGYIVSEADLPGLEPGEVQLELRRKSLILYAEDESLEFEYKELHRVQTLLEFAFADALRTGALEPTP
jgi:HSP20 family molecular chaperone IbpA